MGQRLTVFALVGCFALGHRLNVHNATEIHGGHVVVGVETYYYDKKEV